MHEDLAVFVQQLVNGLVRRAIANDAAVERINECVEHLALNDVRDHEHTALSLTEADQETAALLLGQQYRTVLRGNVTKEPSRTMLVIDIGSVECTYGFRVQFLKQGLWNKNVM